MIIFKQAENLQLYLARQTKKGLSIGFVPTMGALHQGHISLIAVSKSSADITICSIFVNPTQFNDPKDFEKYPITIDKDILLLVQNFCDVLFLPSVQEVYPGGTTPNHHYNLGGLEHILEGEFRPGHFQGVSQVMDRLLHIVNPTKLFLGQKDYQQQLVIRRLIQLLHLPTKVITAHTLREPTGLALSSRNMRLSAEQQKQASAIYRMLVYIKSHIGKSKFELLEQHATEYLLSHHFDKVEYVKIIDADTLTPATDQQSSAHLVVVVAAFIGGVRLIDNMIIDR